MMRKYLPIAGVLVLAACASGVDTPLRDFVKDPGVTRSRIEPLPQAKAYSFYPYAAAELDDPFKPRKIGDTGGDKSKPKENAPDLLRVKEALEQFPLENLRMVGTIEQGKLQFALVLAPDKVVHRVKVGNYLGQNHGQITSITEAAIKLKETVQEGADAWTRRDAELLLAEEDQKK